MLVEVYFKKTNILAVRPISCDEESRWIELVSRHHYLGFNGLIGEQIKYVAVLDGSWVGLLGWASSAYKCADITRRAQWHNLKWLVAVRVAELSSGSSASSAPLLAS